MMQKVKAIRSDKLRKSAQGQDCILQTAVCCHDSSTVVLCHAPHSESKGMGHKGDDSHAIWACHACHDWLDGRAHDVPRHVREAAFDAAYPRQVAEWLRQGVLK